jgi:molecular chaperone HscB
MDWSYFTLFNIKPSLKIDAQQLKTKYYELSRYWHPDRMTQEDEATQIQALEQSATINKAYKVLSDEEALLEYVLTEIGLLKEDQNQLPPDFLMEMMEMNEQLQEALLDNNPEEIQAIKKNIQSLKIKLRNEVEPYFTENLEDAEASKKMLPVKNFYLKQKYLRRILDRINQ